MRHLRGMSDDMVGKNRKQDLGSPRWPWKAQYTTWGRQEESPLIRKRKRGKPAGWRMGS